MGGDCKESLSGLPSEEPFKEKKAHQTLSLAKDATGSRLHKKSGSPDTKRCVRTSILPHMGHDLNHPSVQEMGTATKSWKVQWYEAK